MTLETLAKDIAASAEAQAKAMLKEAKAEADAIIGEAETKATSISDEASARAGREAEQISQEMVASARQGNQKELLIARRGVLDATYDAAKAQLADPGMKGRATLLKSLLKHAGDISGKDFVLRPVTVDATALKKEAGSRSIGDEIDGLGGFMMEAADGSVSFDFRFDTLLDRTWNDERAAINETLFG